MSHITLARVLAVGLGLFQSSRIHAFQAGHTRHTPGATAAVTFMTTKSSLLPGHTCVCACVLTLTPITHHPLWHSLLLRAVIALQGPGLSHTFYFRLHQSEEIVSTALAFT